MREMLATPAAIYRQGTGEEVALVTDGRFSGGTRGLRVGHLGRLGKSSFPPRRGYRAQCSHDHFRRQCRAALPCHAKGSKPISNIDAVPCLVSQVRR